MSRLLGIHWVATTFGTWLHGDPRGSWKNGRLIDGDPFLEDAVRARMLDDAVVLTDGERELVAESFGATVREKSWSVHAATVQPTHVHLIFGALADPIKTVIAAMKYRSAAAVLAQRRSSNERVVRSLWTGGRFPIFVDDEEHLLNAIEYVRRHNRREGLPDEPYPWITPLRR